MKKLLISLIVVVLVLAGCLTIFAACSSTDVNHTIYFYTSQGTALAPYTEKAIESFQEKFPGWTVEHSRLGGYDDVLSTVRQDLLAGTQPDLAYCYPDHLSQYLKTGAVVDLNEYLLNSKSYTNSDGVKIDRIGFTQEDVDSFIDTYMQEGYINNIAGDVNNLYADDALLCLPFSKSTEVLYYNATVLEKLGLQPATTWEEMWRQCAVIKAAYPLCTPLGYDSDANWFITMAQQMGFGYTDIDENNHYKFVNNQAAAWLAQVAQYYNSEYVTTQKMYGGYTSDLFKKGPDDGGLVYCIGSSGGASYQKPAAGTFTAGVAAIPGVDATHNFCISQGASLCMFTGGNNPGDPTEKEIMTFQFVKELLSAEFQAYFGAGTGYNPMRQDAFDTQTYKDFLAKIESEGDIVAMTANVSKGLSDRFFTSPAFVGSSTARSQMESVMGNVFSGVDPMNALQTAYKNCGGK